MAQMTSRSLQADTALITGREIQWMVSRNRRAQARDKQAWGTQDHEGNQVGHLT